MSRKTLRLTCEQLERRDQPSFASPVSYDIGVQPDPFVPNAAPINVVTADLDGDGNLDLAVTHKIDSSLYLLRGKGDGTFNTAVRVPIGEAIEGRMFAGDFNNDQKIDLFLPGASSQAIVLLGNGNGTFRARIDSSSFSAAGAYPRGWGVGDFNGDGNLDVASTLPSTSSDSGGYIVLPGRGDGTFGAGVVGPMVLHYSRWMTVGDFNEDGKLDMATADGIGASDNTGTAELSILIGRGDNTFALGARYASPQLPDEDDVHATANPENVYAYDLDRDGHLDIVECTYDNTLNVFMGNGDGSFHASRSYFSGHYPRGVVGADVDGDGTLDLVVTNVGINQGAAQFAASGVEEGSVAILHGNGDGTFQPAVQYQPFDWPGWTAAGDFNADGAADLAVTRVFDAHSVEVMLNDLPESQSFVRALYQDFLSRSPDNSEVASWVGYVETIGQSFVATAIATSHESHQREIRGMYSYYLGRNPVLGEESAWVQWMDQGATAEQVSAQFLSSAEFGARSNSREGSSNSDANFVRGLYRTLLLRSGTQVEASEVQDWVNLLDGGVARSQVALGFVSSQEFRGNAVRSLYGASLGGTISWIPNLLERGSAIAASEVVLWSASPFDVDEIGAIIAGSAEYFAKS